MKQKFEFNATNRLSMENYNDSHTAAAPGKWYISGFPIEQIRKSVRIEKLQLGWIGGVGWQNIDHMEDVPPSSGSIYRVFCIQRD